MKLTVCLASLVVFSSEVIAQTPVGPKVGLVQYVQLSQGGITRQLLAAAERMPEADYGFKPSAMNEARTYGAVIAHAADGMFEACARVKAVPNPRPELEKTLTQKVDIVKALSQSIAFCTEAFSAVTDQTANDYVRQGPVEVPRIAVLMGVLAHNAEMFGISTVYLRARSLVPPGSERR